MDFSLTKHNKISKIGISILITLTLVLSGMLATTQNPLPFSAKKAEASCGYWYVYARYPNGQAAGIYTTSSYCVRYFTQPSVGWYVAKDDCPGGYHKGGGCIPSQWWLHKR